MTRRFEDTLSRIALAGSIAADYKHISPNGKLKFRQCHIQGAGNADSLCLDSQALTS